MKHYTPSYIRVLTGLPENVCRERLKPARKFGPVLLYDLDQAIALKAQYDVERAEKIAAARRRIAEKRCIICGAPRIPQGWPYCAEHLPPSVRKRLHLDSVED